MAVVAANRHERMRTSSFSLNDKTRLTTVRSFQLDQFCRATSDRGARIANEGEGVCYHFATQFTGSPSSLLIRSN